MQESKIYLIFEYLTMDLKKYMDTGIPKDGQMDPKLTKSYLYQVIFHQLCLEQCLQLTYILSVAARHPVLSPEESSPQRHEAPESPYWQERRHQDRRLRSGPRIRDPHPRVHARGCHPLVQGARGEVQLYYFLCCMTPSPDFRKVYEIFKILAYN